MSSLRRELVDTIGGARGALDALQVLWRDQEGTTSVEYAMVLAVVVMGSAAAWHSLTASMVRALSSVMDSVDGAESVDP